MLQSIDLAIRDLLVAGDDPFALASYLRMLRTHRLSLVNGDRLADWGTRWVRQVVVEGQQGRRWDEEVAAAALAALALADTPAVVGAEEAIRRGLGRILTAALTFEPIPLGQPTYGAALLLAAARYCVDESRLRSAALATARALVGGVTSGRGVGLALAAELFRAFPELPECATVRPRLLEALDDPRTGHECRIYLLQALWLMDDPSGPAEDWLWYSQQALLNSPAWAHVMTGVEDVPSAGDGRAVVIVSHLFRAALLDLLVRAEEATAARATTLIVAERARRRLLTWSPVLGGALVLGVSWAALLWWARPWLDAGWQYWVENDYSALTKGAAWLALAGTALAGLLLMWTAVIMWTLWQLPVHTGVTDDREILRILGRRLCKVVPGWLVVVVVAAVINLWTGVLGPAFQHTVTRP